uniref:Uncharacterized protein n=1 Tax=Tanacetum cinerariifolium TaxID=118510 RepID=A0A699H943_TANCI|nr:hypothetical protein [Tanacetum cinerariifolium]
MPLALLGIVKKGSYGSNDMAHNHFLEEARKKTQDRNWNLKLREMPSARTHHTPNACTTKPGSNNQTFRNWSASKSSNVKLNKCVFNANHDAYVTKFLKEVNSHAKIQSHKSKNNIKLVGKKSNVNKPERRIFKGHRLSPNKSFAVHEKTSPRSCLRWKPTCGIFKTVGLRWVPTGKIFTDTTTKVDIIPPNGSNDDINNPYECDQTFNVSAGTLNLSAGPAPQRKERCTLQCALSLKEEKYSYLRAVLSTTSISSHARSVNKWINIFGLYTSRLLDAACKKALNQLKKGLLYQKTDHALNFIGVIRLVRLGIRSHDSGRDLPRDNPLVIVAVLRYDIKRSKSENKGIMSTEMELVLEQTQQGTSHQVSVTVNSSLRSLKPKRTIESRAKRSSINLIRTLFQYTCLLHTVKTRNILRVLRIILVVLPKHPSDTYVFTVKMEILLEPTSNKHYGRSILTDSKVTPTKHGE